MSTTFKRKIENFTCGHCKKKVKGNGYTNHCPFCLWSKHVDINPGDRANTCGGMMEPVSYDLEKNQYHIIFHCQNCDAFKRNKFQDGDNFEVLLKLAQQTVDKFTKNPSR